MADGFVIGQPGYANLDDFLEALDRTIPGTGEWTPPAYLFGRPDSDWVDSNSFLMVTTDAGGNTDLLFLNASDLDLEDALAPSNGYLIDTDDDGTLDSLSQQFYYDRALGVLQNLTWTSLPMPFANVSTDGLQVVTSAVYAEFQPGKWVAGIRVDINSQVNFVVDDPELPELGAVTVPMQTATLHPMAYVTDKAAAITWAQHLANVSPFLGAPLQTQTVNIGEWGAIWVLTTAGAGPENVFVEHEAASVEEYRDAIAAGAGIVEESVTAEGYTIMDGNGDTHHLMSAADLSCGDKCVSERSKTLRNADDAYRAAAKNCGKSALNSFANNLSTDARNCCFIGSAIGGGVGGAVGSLPGGLTGAAAGCLAGVIICGAIKLLWNAAGYAACIAEASEAKAAAQRAAQDAWAACCAACEEDDPACHPAY